MFFLLRMAFWLGLVLVLLPRDKTPESEKLPQIGASEAVQAATAAVSDMSQFCKRQPAACEVGGQAATVIGQRAQDGARKLYQIITDKRQQPDHTGSIGVADTPNPAAEADPRDTLTPDDLAVGMARRADPSTGNSAAIFRIARLRFRSALRPYIIGLIRSSGPMRAIMTIDEIRDNFALLDEWDDRYRYVIELGRTLEPMPEAEHSAANKVQGCTSQVWLSKRSIAATRASRY